MKCKNCGNEFTEGIFCPECGTKIDVSNDSKNVEVTKDEEKVKELENQKSKEEVIVAEQPKRKQEEALQEKKIEEQVRIENEKEKQNAGKPMAIASLIFGIISICSLGAFIIPEILGIVFAFISKKGDKMKGTAKAGLICSIIGITIFSFFMIASTIISK